MKAPLDLQMNGYAGIDFNSDDLTAEGLGKACALLREDGAGGILATIITAEPDRMCARLSRLAELRSQDEGIAEMIRASTSKAPFSATSPDTSGRIRSRRHDPPIRSSWNDSWKPRTA